MVLLFRLRVQAPGCLFDVFAQSEHGSEAEMTALENRQGYVTAI